MGHKNDFSKRQLEESLALALRLLLLLSHILGEATPSKRDLSEARSNVEKGWRRTHHISPLLGRGGARLSSNYWSMHSSGTSEGHQCGWQDIVKRDRSETNIASINTYKFVAHLKSIIWIIKTITKNQHIENTLQMYTPPNTTRLRKGIQVDIIK